MAADNDTDSDSAAQQPKKKKPAPKPAPDRIAQAASVLAGPAVDSITDAGAHDLYRLQNGDGGPPVVPTPLPHGNSIILRALRALDEIRGVNAPPPPPEEATLTAAQRARLRARGK